VHRRRIDQAQPACGWRTSRSHTRSSRRSHTSYPIRVSRTTPAFHASFSPHVDPCRVQVDGGQLGWKSRLGATLWLLTVGHRCLHEHRGDRQWQWGRERRSCSTLPHGIRALPVTTGVATGSRDHPHQRAHRTMVPTASHGPLPRRESPHPAPQFLAVARPRSGINTLIRVRCVGWQDPYVHPPAPRPWSLPLPGA
jgi:hypothetical protein